MDTKLMIKSLREEQNRIEKIISLLEQNDGSALLGIGRAPRAARRPMSAQQRKRLSDAQKKRWAERKKMEKKEGGKSGD